MAQAYIFSIVRSMDILQRVPMPEQQQGRGSNKGLRPRAIETCKKQKNHYQLYLFLFSSNVLGGAKYFFF